MPHIHVYKSSMEFTKEGVGILWVFRMYIQMHRIFNLRIDSGSNVKKIVCMCIYLHTSRDEVLTSKEDNAQGSEVQQW